MLPCSARLTPHFLQIVPKSFPFDEADGPVIPFVFAIEVIVHNVIGYGNDIKVTLAVKINHLPKIHFAVT